MLSALAVDHLVADGPYGHEVVDHIAPRLGRESDLMLGDLASPGALTDAEPQPFPQRKVSTRDWL